MINKKKNPKNSHINKWIKLKISIDFLFPQQNNKKKRIINKWSKYNIGFNNRLL